MLGKYYKYEIRSAGKMMSTMYGILAAATAWIVVLYTFMHRANIQSNESVLGGISIALYCITMVVVIVTAFIYLCHRFYQTMYSSQGYLTHTLPLTATQILNAKLLSSFGYLLLTMTLCILSVLLTAAVVTGEGPDVIACVIKETLDELASQLKTAQAIVAAFMIVMACMAILYLLLLCYAGFSIGQLFTHSKGVRGIIAIIVLYYINQIISVIFFAIGLLLTHRMSGSDFVKWPVYGAFFIIICWSILYYMINRVVVQKHLNLE